MNLLELGLKLYDKGFNVIPVNENKQPLTSWDSSKRIEREELGVLLVNAKGIAIAGGSENPFKPVSILVLIDIDKPSDLEKYPTLKKLIERTVSWKTGIRCPKCEAKKIGKDIEVIEPGKRFKCLRCNTEFSAEEAKRGLGLIVAVSKEAGEKLLRNTIRGSVELLVNNYQLIPPSIHPSGVNYEWIKPFDFDKPSAGIYTLLDLELEQLLSEMGATPKVMEMPKIEVVKAPTIEFKALTEKASKNSYQILVTLDGKAKFLLFFYLMNSKRESKLKIALKNIEVREPTVMTDCYVSDIADAWKRCRDPTSVVLRKMEDKLGLRFDIDKAVEEVSKNLELWESAIAKAELGEIVESGLDPVEIKLKPIRVLDFNEKISYLVNEIEHLLELKLIDLDYFAEMKNHEKASEVLSIIRGLFEFVRLPPTTPLGGSSIFLLDKNVLLDPGEVIKPIVGSLVNKKLSNSGIEKEITIGTYATPKNISWEQVGPIDKLNLANGVLDLHDLTIKDDPDVYFTYRIPLKLSLSELDEIRGESYDIERNEVYRAWRDRFDDENWEYLIYSIGTWLAPFRMKHIGFLIGPPDSGKSTLIKNLAKNIEPIVSFTSLRSLTDSNYPFNLESLIGKQLLMYSEKVLDDNNKKSRVTLKNLELLNNLLGEQDYIQVHRKFKSSVVIRSLKSAFFSMNDPPIIKEYEGGTMQAFLERLSIIHIELKDKSLNKHDFNVDEKEAFKFLLWCRVKLEKNDWKVKKKSPGEMLEDLMEATNSAFRFLEQEVAKDPISTIKGTKLYEAYRAWCMEQGITPMNPNTFYSYVATKYVKYEREKRVWFKGLKLINELKEERKRELFNFDNS
jgi:DNA-directed RNA polymerase subunit RPC12/RpoP